MSAILLITLQKDAQQIDLTQENWFPDLIFIPFENLHIWPTDLWRKKTCSKKEISGNMNISNQVLGFVGWVGDGQESWN